MKTLSPLLPVLLAISLGALAACSSTASQQNVPFPSQDVEVTSPDLCRIYIARTGQVRGSIRSILVTEYDEEIGAIDSDEYLCWERRPGRSILEVVFEGSITEGEVESLVPIDARAGEVLYFRIDLERKTDDPYTFQEWGKPSATRLSADEGRALIAERNPAAAED
jgi:hypothetical protein